MKHRATPDFWYYYRQLPPEIRELADRRFELLKQDPRYPSLHFKKVGRFWSTSQQLPLALVRSGSLKSLDTNQ